MTLWRTYNHSRMTLWHVRTTTTEWPYDTRHAITAGWPCDSRHHSRMTLWQVRITTAGWPCDKYVPQQQNDPMTHATPLQQGDPATHATTAEWPFDVRITTAGWPCDTYVPQQQNDPMTHATPPQQSDPDLHATPRHHSRVKMHTLYCNRLRRELLLLWRLVF